MGLVRFLSLRAGYTELQEIHINRVKSVVKTFMMDYTQIIKITLPV